jgi:hypothetical protein
MILQHADPGIIGVRFRSNGFVGADSGAHAAADTAVCRFCALANAGKSAVFAASFFLEDIKLRHPLAPVGQKNGFLGADSGTIAAKGTPVLTVLDNPLEIKVS